VSRTTHELNKAKRRVLQAAVELQADPDNVAKRLALVDAIEDLEKDRQTVQGAILKAIAGRNQPVNLAEASDFGGDPDTASDSASLTKRVRARAAGVTTTKASALNDGRGAPMRKTLNMDYGRVGLTEED
jgi:hypothetical protein